MYPNHSQVKQPIGQGVQLGNPTPRFVPENELRQPQSEVGSELDRLSAALDHMQARWDALCEQLQPVTIPHPSGVSASGCDPELGSVVGARIQRARFVVEDMASRMASLKDSLAV